MDQQDHVVFKDLGVTQEELVPKVRLDHKDSKESLEFQEPQDLLDLQDQKVPLDSKVF